MHVFRFAIHFFLFGLVALMATPPKDSNDTIRAKSIAEDYQNLFSGDEAFVDTLGESAYEAIFYSSDSAENNAVRPETKQIALRHIAAKLDRLGPIAAAPRVDWGREQEFKEKGLAALIPEGGPIRRLTREATWFAKETWANDPEAALLHLRNAQAAARHMGQDTPSLISHLTQIAAETIILNTLAELAPQMSPEQMATALAGIESLPETGSLADAIRTERDLWVGWFRKKIETGLQAWEASQPANAGFRFPEDLRLAGVVLLPNQPIRLSLHNTRLGQTFWLEEGKEVNDIRIERVEFSPPRAWLVCGDRSALVNLEKETIQGRYVPWEVLLDAFGTSFGTDIANLSEAQQEEAKKQLAEFGLTPETAFDSLDRLDAYYTHVLERLDLPVDEFQAWEAAYEESVAGNDFMKSMAPSLGRVLETSGVFQTKYTALKVGFDVQANGISDPLTSEDFIVTPNPEGFTVTPTEYAGHPRAYHYSLHFGTRPPEPEE